MKKAFKYRFYPTVEQVEQLAKTFGCVRYVWNWALELRTKAYRENNEKLQYAALSRKLTELKCDPEREWLREPRSACLQQSLRHQEQAFANFFAKRGRYPKFKNRHGKQSATYSYVAFRWDGDALILGKMSKPLRVVWCRPLEGRPVSATVTRDASGRYFVSLQCDVPQPEPLPETDRAVGVDLGLNHFAVLSDGQKISHPKYLAHDLRRLRRAQQALSRKQKGSNRRAQARLRVAKIHARIADKRTDFLHKLSTTLIRENQTIRVEDLAVKNMVRNHSLARSISDSGWAEFVRQLEYKAQWYGRTVEKIGRFYPSSKTCSACGHVLPELSLGTREWACPECGVLHDRDVNAAQNILAARSAVAARGGNVRPVGSSDLIGSPCEA